MKNITASIVDADNRWIPEKKYRQILERVPILCVDVLLVASDQQVHDDSPGKRRVVLINRSTPEGNGWCLVGGAVLRDEPLETAVLRHVRATLGTDCTVLDGSLRLGLIAQYFTRPGVGLLVDP